MLNGVTRWVGNSVAVDSAPEDVRLTGLLNSLTGRPVLDATGLTGRYNFVLTFSSGTGVTRSVNPAGQGPDNPADDAAPSLFVAVESQLGLKLESKKVAIDCFVVDKADRVHLEN
jgi:uncharacterized protein (TIGR03435 family)